MGWGAGGQRGFKEESDGCDLVRLFLLEHVDKNDRHKLPCEAWSTPPSLLTSMEGSLQPSDFKFKSHWHGSSQPRRPPPPCCLKWQILGEPLTTPRLHNILSYSRFEDHLRTTPARPSTPPTSEAFTAESCYVYLHPSPTWESFPGPSLPVRLPDLTQYSSVPPLI